MAQFGGAPNFLAALDAFQAGREVRERNRLAELDQRGRDLAGQYLQTGDKSLLAQLTATNPALGMRFMEQNEAREDRQADRDWRTAESQRAQSNADRSFGLQQRGFNADEAYRRQQLALEREKLAKAQSDAMRPDLKDITTIRKEIGDLPSYKTYSAALPVYNSMVKAADTKAGDLNLVYGLAKIFDPTSVVREGEQVLVRDTASLPDWLVGQINSLNGGNRLLAETRKSLMAEARNRVDAYKGAYESNLQPYRGIAGRYQINEADIIPQMGALEEVPANGQGDPLGIR